MKVTLHRGKVVVEFNGCTLEVPTNEIQVIDAQNEYAEWVLLARSLEKDD